jgi:hypothetical protein
MSIRCGASKSKFSEVWRLPWTAYPATMHSTSSSSCRFRLSRGRDDPIWMKAMPPFRCATRLLVEPPDWTCARCTVGLAPEPHRFRCRPTDAWPDQTAHPLFPTGAQSPEIFPGLLVRALSRSRVLLVNREARSKTAWRKINDLGNSLSSQIPSKIAYSWPV